MIEFPHKPPKGYSYEFESFKKNVIAIWIRDHKVYDYNLGKSVRCIWGFYDSKKGVYLSPVNSKTPGKCVDIDNTTPYTAMPLKQTPLTAAFV
jgi:hypothetical protein